MVDLLLINGRVVLTNRVARGALAVADGRVQAFLADGDTLPSASAKIDLEGAYLAPGFVDIHVHGGVGVDCNDADAAGLDRLAGWLASQGVTRFLPTLVPTSLDQYRRAASTIADWIAWSDIDAPTGAVPVGIHFEGPFVSASRCGALHAEHFLSGVQREDFFATLDAASVADLPIKILTVAPEIDGGLDLVREAVGRGFVVSVGHTRADFETLDAAFDAGAHHMTHFFNAMEPLHHRNPGPVGWGLRRQRVTVDVIADFEHVHPEVLKLVFGVKTANRVALISDAIAPAGLGDGSYTVWGEEISVRDAKTSNAAGALAGSVISMADAARNAVALGATIGDVVRMASVVPARVAGLETLGGIAPGAVADLVSFGDALVPELTIVEGRIVHQAKRIGRAGSQEA